MMPLVGLMITLISYHSMIVNIQDRIVYETCIEIKSRERMYFQIKIFEYLNA